MSTCAEGRARPQAHKHKTTIWAGARHLFCHPLAHLDQPYIDTQDRIARLRPLPRSVAFKIFTVNKKLSIMRGNKGKIARLRPFA